MNFIKERLLDLSRNKKIFLIIFSDFWIAFFCWVIFGPPLTFLIATDFSKTLFNLIYENINSFLLPIMCLFVYFLASKFYTSRVRFFDSKDSIFRALIGSFIFGFSWGFFYISQYEIIKTSFLATVILQSLLLSSVLYAFLQISRDIAKLIIYPSVDKLDAKPILIYGAGTTGNQLYQSLKGNLKIKIIGFFDISLKLSGASINNIRIFSKQEDLKRLTTKYRNLEIYLAIPSLGINERRKIISGLEKYKVAVRSIPALHEIVANEKKLAELQDLSIDDILPRTRVANSEITFDGINIMITGAGGSIGSEIVKQVLLGKPRKIILFEISEINLYSIESEINAFKKANKISTVIVGILGDVKDIKRVEYIMNSHSVDYLYHAAAYKHVPIVEHQENISEGIKNNVFGTRSICEASKNCNLKKVVVISTDKAVRPTNIMGASKRFAEMIVQSFDTKSKDTKFCMVRFGNVINSSGSVIPLFRKQIMNGGPVTITHKNVTRFFMTISEASSLVIQAGEYAQGGEVFILDMGEQIKIKDLAERLIYLSGRNVTYDDNSEGIKIEEVGLRPGEKLYEELLISGREKKTPNDKIFRSNENFPSEKNLKIAYKSLLDGVKNDNIFEIKKTLKNYVEGFN